ncbi:hypothetical protein WA158_001817 [Blastocystis sp. Blastoise]
MSLRQTVQVSNTYKIVMLGRSMSGKTCLIHTYVKGMFKAGTLATIGVELQTKFITVDDQLIKLQIWDTAGSDQYESITKSYYRGAHGIVLLYDITYRESFEKIGYYMQSIYDNADEDVRVILVGNKSDLEDKRAVSYEEGKRLAGKYNISFFESSAATGQNISDIFMTLTRECMQVNPNSNPQDDQKKIIIDPTPKPKPDPKQCC